MARKKAVEETAVEEKPRRPKLFKVKSKTGSSLHIVTTNPLVPLNSPQYGFEIPWNRFALVGKEWQENPYLLDAIERGDVEVDESPGLPTPAAEMPTEFSAEHREWLKALLYGPYNSGFKQLLTDWRSAGAVKKDRSRIGMLSDKVLPVCIAARRLEATIQNRPELLDDLSKVIQFVQNAEWDK